MKLLISKSWKHASLALLLLVGLSVTAKAQGGRLELAQLDALSSRASQTVVLNIDERVMQMTARFLSGKDDDDRKIKELINGLKGVYVRSFEFEREGDYSEADIESIRTQLRNPGWNQILKVNSKKEGSVEVYLMTVGGTVEGLAVLATEPKEVTIVNIIGPVNLDKLTELEGHFGVPELGIEKPKPKAKN